MDRGGLEPPTLGSSELSPACKAGVLPIELPAHDSRQNSISSYLLPSVTKVIIAQPFGPRTNGLVAQSHGRREAWLEHSTDNREVKGSNPFQPTIELLRMSHAFNSQNHMK